MINSLEIQFLWFYCIDQLLTAPGHIGMYDNVAIKLITRLVQNQPCIKGSPNYTKP